MNQRGPKRGDFLRDAGLDLEDVARQVVVRFDGDPKNICIYLEEKIPGFITSDFDWYRIPEDDLHAELDYIAESPELRANFYTELAMLLFV